MQSMSEPIQVVSSFALCPAVTLVVASEKQMRPCYTNWLYHVRSPVESKREAPIRATFSMSSKSPIATSNERE